LAGWAASIFRLMSGFVFLGALGALAVKKSFQGGCHELDA
jgi:hypothetical protein